MQIDGEASALIGLASSIVASAIGYGVMREKVSRTESRQGDLDCRIDELEERLNEKFVTHQYFNVVLQPIKELLNAVQGDVKEILRLQTEKNKSRGDRPLGDF